MLISQVSIKNFRSIQSQVFNAKSLNVLVGNNDIGKSNFLKALNLFFNNETELGMQFNFKNDFSSFAIVSKKKAPEVVIELTIAPPRSFEKSRQVIWRKIWRKEGLVSNDKWYSDGNAFEGRKKIGFWLNQIKYSYVPAIKGQDYFAKLLGDLHNVLSETIEHELKSASENFIDKIRSHTKGISEELFEKLRMKSSLQIPTDLSVLFEVLDFETTKNQRNVSLRYRGDGIKARHIPIILKFIGEQRNVNRQKGAIKSNAIWGYEEPENNLELSKAFDLASDFLEYSDGVQIFLTTHSPAFYSIGALNKGHAETYIIKPDNESQASVIQNFDSQNLTTLDQEMGLLPIITPHIKVLIDEKEKLLDSILQKEKELKALDGDVLFVEGETDKAIIEKAINIHAPDLAKQFSIRSGDGFNGVADLTLSWFYSRKQARAISLFDRDEAGVTGRKKVENTAGDGNNKNFRLMSLPKPPHLKSIYQKGINLTFSIEELFSVEILRHAKSKDWLEFKDELVTSFRIPEISFIDHCAKSLKITNDEFLYMHKVKFFNKGDFCKYVVRLKNDEEAVAFESFKYLIDDLKKAFSTENRKITP